MYLRQKRFVVNLSLYVKRSIVYYCSQTHLPDFPSMNCFAYSSSEHQFWSLNSVLISSAVKQTTWEDDLLRIIAASQCQENSNPVNLRESKVHLSWFRCVERHRRSDNRSNWKLGRIFGIEMRLQIFSFSDFQKSSLNVTIFSYSVFQIWSFWNSQTRP